MATATKLEDAALAAAGDTNADAQAHHVVAQDAAVPPVVVLSPDAAPVASKRAAKKAKKPEEKREVEGPSVDHAYLSFLHKRIRLYKKKLEKIRALEAACATEGKVLNDQQREVVGNKALVEKMIAEFESLREQFIEVYAKEEEEKKVAKQVEEAKENKEIKAIEAEACVAKEEDDEPKIAETDAAPVVEQVPRDTFAYVEDLLRTLHAVTLHQALGKDVPPVLDYFSKVVLGTTRPPAEVPFEENLAESLVEATRYLTKSEKIVALDYTYKDLRAMVEKLGAPATSVEQVDDAPATTPEIADDEAPVGEDPAIVQAPAAEELPQINFFTESQLIPEDVEVPTEDKDNQHEELLEAIEPTVSEEEAPEDSPEEEEVPVAAPPKSVTNGAAKASTGKNVWVRKPKAVEATRNGSSDEKSNQRRRSHGRSKSNNNSNSPRNGDGKSLEGPDGATDRSNNNNNNKPRRPRPQRSNDENGGSFNANRANKAAGKTDERRSRSERPVRKQQPTQPQQNNEAAQV